MKGVGVGVLGGSDGRRLECIVCRVVRRVGRVEVVECFEECRVL